MSPSIRKTLLATGILLVIYTLYVTNIHPDLYIKQQQWQENAIKAQDYLFGDMPQSVIVGSSLSAKLTDVLPDYYNLAFHGQGGFDGLRILFEKNEFPDTVLIEMNSLLVPPNKSFINNITNPALSAIRKNVLPFREGKQPLPLLVWQLDGVVKLFSAHKPATTKVNISGKVFNQLLAVQVLKYKIAPQRQAMQESLHLLRRYVNALEARNVTVIFFDLPVHSSLCNLPLSDGIRNGFFEAFPRNRYRYIDKPDCDRYKTTDGIHLTNTDARKYAAYLTVRLASVNVNSETMKLLDSFFH